MDNKRVAKVTFLVMAIICAFGIRTVFPVQSIKAEVVIDKIAPTQPEATLETVMQLETAVDTTPTKAKPTTTKTTVKKEVIKEVVQEVGVGWDKIDNDSLGGLFNEDAEKETTIPTTNTTKTSAPTNTTATSKSGTDSTTLASTTTTTSSTTTTTSTTITATTLPAPDARLKVGTVAESEFMNHIRVKNTKTGTLYDGSSKENLQKAIAFVVKMEMGTSQFGLKSTEAWKAQAVAAYTYLLRYCWSGATYSFSLSSDLNLNNATDKKIYDAVGQVLGVKLLDTKQSALSSQLCLTSYYAASAGVSSSSGKVWVTQLAYLKSVKSDVETDEMIRYYTGGYMGLISTYQTTYTNVIQKLTAKYGEIFAETKEGQPCIYATEWDGGEGKYIAKTNLYYINTKGVKTYIRGSDFRDTVGYIRSHAFTVKQDGDNLTFTALGYGHGVGLSQMGAVIYANEKGWDYIQILQHYYSVTATSNHQLVAPRW